MAKLFGTDGIRALMGDEKMSPKMGEKMGMALVKFCRKRNLPEKIIIGRDTRESGPILEDAVAGGVLSMGGEAIVAGIIPTPGIAYLVKEQKAGAGLVISASHNPASYNGLKPFKSDGTKLTDEEELEMEEYILDESIKNEIEAGKDSSLEKKIALSDAKEKYANFLLDRMPAELKDNKLKLVLDCANGATFKVAPAVFEKVSDNLELLSANPDGKNINDSCGSQHTGNLKNKVIESKADLGLAFDGDGDRMIAVDEKGNELNGDQIIYIIAKMMKEKNDLKNDVVVTTVMSNLGFVNKLKELNMRHFATPVGDRPVYFKMKEEGAVLGGEECGHIIVANFQYAGDGIAGGLMLLAAMNYFRKPLSELVREVTLYPKILVNVEVGRKPELETIPEIKSIIAEIENKLGDFGRVLVRYSGTENLCRVMVEGKDKKEITGYVNEIAEVIKDKLS